MIKQTDLFWERYGGRKHSGDGFEEEKKLKDLIEFSEKVIFKRSKKSLDETRVVFNKSKFKRHGLNSHKKCFVCLNIGEIRHHIVPISNGGRNAKRNLVTLCKKCHSKVHPWLETKKDMSLINNHKNK